MFTDSSESEKKVKELYATSFNELSGMMKMDLLNWMSHIVSCPMYVDTDYITNIYDFCLKRVFIDIYEWQIITLNIS